MLNGSLACVSVTESKQLGELLDPEKSKYGKVISAVLLGLEVQIFCYRKCSMLAEIGREGIEPLRKHHIFGFFV